MARENDGFNDGADCRPSGYSYRNWLGELDHRPALDQTGLIGRFDFDIEFTPQRRTADAQPEAFGPTFAEALKNQLGLKLVKQTGPVNVFVIDHIEMPSPN